MSPPGIQNGVKKHHSKMQKQQPPSQPPAAAAAAAAPAAAAADGYRSLGLRLHADSPFIAYVFLKRQKAAAAGGQDAAGHQQQQQQQANSTDVPNALYITGLPLGLDEASLAAVFGLFGGVADVVMHPSKRSAAVVYDAPGGVSAALRHAGSGQIVEYELPSSSQQQQQQQQEPLGLKAWVAAHKVARPGNAALQQQLDAWVEEHEAAEAARRAAQQAAMAEDGWTVVTRDKGRKRSREVGGMATVSGGMPQTAAAAAAARAAAVGKQSHQVENFYRFQAREQRRNELVELRQKFDEGRKRLAALKAARHFKPS